MKLFDEQYKNDECLWGLKPSRIVKQSLKYKQSGIALDLGCGEGRNALFLAKEGFDVTAIDSSEEGIKKLNRLVLENEVKVDTIIQDINGFEFRLHYDIILSTATLHFLDGLSIKRTLQKMKTHTSVKGLNIISVFTENNPYKGFPYLFKKDELRDSYNDWKILEYREFMTPLEKHGKNGRPHRHGIAELIAIKN